MNILITGGASGLGEAITRRLAQSAENFVYFTYFGSIEKADKIQAEFANTKAMHVNFQDEESIASLVTSIGRFSLDVLINNALASHEQNHFHKIATAQFLESFSKNILPTIRITQEAIKVFRKKKFGKIITVLTSGLIGSPPTGWSEYTANKAYLMSLAKSWAAENRNFNITSNCISPAFMLTDLNNQMDERIVEMAVQSHPLQKLLDPKEVAESVNFMVNASQQMNGVNLIMNAAENMV